MTMLQMGGRFASWPKASEQKIFEEALFKEYGEKIKTTKTLKEKLSLINQLLQENWDHLSPEQQKSGLDAILNQLSASRTRADRIKNLLVRLFSFGFFQSEDFQLYQQICELHRNKASRILASIEDAKFVGDPKPWQEPEKNPM